MIREHPLMFVLISLLHGCWTGSLISFLQLTMAATETKLETLRLLSRVRSQSESNNSLLLRLAHPSHCFTCDHWTVSHLSLTLDSWPMTPAELPQHSSWGKFHAWGAHCVTGQCAITTHRQRSFYFWANSSRWNVGILTTCSTKSFLAFDINRARTHYLAQD